MSNQVKVEETDVVKPGWHHSVCLSGDGVRHATPGKFHAFSAAGRDQACADDRVLVIWCHGKTKHRSAKKSFQPNPRP